MISPSLSREDGVTLVDTVIAVVVVAVVIGLAYPGFKVANDTMSTSGLRDRAERSGDRILKAITEELRAGHLTNVGAAGAPPELTISRPREEVALTDLTAGGEVPWSPDSRIIRFREMETVKEADVGEDLNRDGDRTDEFSLGIVEIVADGQARPITQTTRVMLALPGYEGDLNGDGNADPMFRVNGRNVEIRLQLYARAENGSILTTVVRGGLRLRNVQD